MGNSASNEARSAAAANDAGRSSRRETRGHTFSAQSVATRAAAAHADSGTLCADKAAAAAAADDDDDDEDDEDEAEDDDDGFACMAITVRSASAISCGA